jgi:prepilin-type N-terminal cleavage/methylation domain-containing protein
VKARSGRGFRYVRECTSGTWVRSRLAPIMSKADNKSAMKGLRLASMSAAQPNNDYALPEGTAGRVGCRLARNDMALSRGFSIVELLVVVAIMLVVTAFAIPTMTTTMDGVRLRGTLGSASNIVGRCRIVAIKKDLTQRLHFSTVGSAVVAFVTDANDPAVAPVPGDNQLSAQYWLPLEFAIPGAPTGPGAPPQLTGLVMWGTALPNINVNVDPYFNARGLPCLPDPVTGVCNPTNGFVYYYRYQNGGRTRWAATSISPAGRIQSWIWNGTGWGN